MMYENQRIIKRNKSITNQEADIFDEKMIQSIRKQDENDQMKKAVDSLYSDYMHDKELTAFTNIDFDNFYEAR